MKHLLAVIVACFAFSIGMPTLNARMACAQETEEKADDSKINSGLLSAVKLRSVGPALMSGRIADIAIDPTNPNIWYVAAGSGGVWKTVNAGTTFEPIFDNYSSYSIGCVTIDPNNSSTVWVGTGENVGGRHVGYGDGIYVSHDGGKSFKNVGLKKSEHLSKIIVHPEDSNIIFVASQGPLWSGGGERGLFKSTDGGKTWDNILNRDGEKGGEYTGVTDIAMDPKNPDVIYAATHQRLRSVWALLNTGPQSGIHKSVDGGATWTELKSGIPGGDKGKIAIQVSPQKSNVVYATIELNDRKGGFFRSQDFGASWKKMSDYTSGGTGPHYYQELFCDPHRFDVVYHANVKLGRTTDGGKNFNSVGRPNKHVDNHAVAFSPTDKNFLLVGCDGGLYRSYDFAKTYSFCGNLPLTQFYKLDVDYDEPFYHIVGGTQDNNTQYGPARTKFVQGIRNSDWRITIGGDGHDNAIDPTDPDIIYCEAQQGYINRFDRKTGESVDIRPRPGSGEKDFRFNWDSPILISPHDHKRIYIASKHLHRSNDRGDSWEKISPDLSRDINRFTLKMMGRVWSIDAGYDLYAMSQYGNITSISESPIVEGLLYVGTDDGLIHVSEDAGENWRKVDKIFGVPEHFFVNDIKADLHDADTVYACIDDHKTGDYQPYLVKSTDRGKTWESMVGDLPERHLVWRIEQDHENQDLFFLGTEYGLFCSINAGEKWIKLSAGAPVIPFRDLAIQRRENDLVGATFGRGFYVLDDYTPLRELSDELLEDNELYLFPVRKALKYYPDSSLGGTTGSQGDSFFRTPNPEFGAMLTYHVRDELKTKKALRKEKEKAAAKKGDDVPTPTWDELREEQLEQPPEIYFEISDESAKVIAKVNAKTSKGLHRVNWDLRYSARSRGPMVAPGTYSAQAYKLVNGEITKLGNAQSIEVVSIIEPSIKGESDDETIEFQLEVAKFSDSVRATKSSLTTAQEKLQEIMKALQKSTNSTPELIKSAHDLELSLKAVDKSLNGDRTLRSRYERDVPSIDGRVRSALSDSLGNSYGFTQTQREQIEIARTDFKAVKEEVKRLLDVEMKALEAQLSESGIPWTSGRPIPD